MKIPKNSQIEQVASKDKTRKIINFISIQPIVGIGDPGQTFAVATNGAMLACVPVEMEEGESAALLTPEQVKEVKKLKDFQYARLNGVLEFNDGRRFPVGTEETEGKYPNVAQVIPEKNRETRFAIALDAEMLCTLQKAFGSSAVKMVFADELSPVMVTPCGKSVKNDFVHGSFGVLMPVRMG